jgi:NADH:ubiquinone oxidoreductase subunit 3 (subunit A)
MTTVLAVILVLELVSLVILVLAGARHGDEQYQRGYEAGRYEAGQAAERARGEW